MTEHPRMSKETLRILELMLSDPSAEWFGMQLSRDTKVQVGTLYPILHRLERAGWLVGSDEDIDPRVEGRPARRLYKLTGKGELAARDRVATGLKVRGARAPSLQPRTGLT